MRQRKENTVDGQSSGIFVVVATAVAALGLLYVRWCDGRPAEQSDWRRCTYIFNGLYRLYFQVQAAEKLIHLIALFVHRRPRRRIGLIYIAVFCPRDFFLNC